VPIQKEGCSHDPLRPRSMWLTGRASLVATSWSGSAVPQKAHSAEERPIYHWVWLQPGQWFTALRW